MKYVVVSTSDDSVTVWDGVTKDPDRPGERAGEVMYFVGAPHGFRVGQKVTLSIKVIEDVPHDPAG